MLGQAAKFYELSGNVNKALRLYMQGGEQCIPEAIQMIGKARQEALTNHMVEWLMGTVDDNPKDPSYLFSLYIELDNLD